MRTLQTLALITLLSCTGGDTAPAPKQNTILGRWQLIEKWWGTIPPGGLTETVENGQIITFHANGQYLSTSYVCPKGGSTKSTYLDSLVFGDTDTVKFVTIFIDCTSMKVDSVKKRGLVYRYDFKGGDLILHPFKYGACDEGCYDKYRRRD